MTNSNLSAAGEQQDTYQEERRSSTAGTGRSKKRRPSAERRGKSITRRIGPSGLGRKAADVDLVSHPEFVVMVANQGTS